MLIAAQILRIDEFFVHELQVVVWVSQQQLQQQKRQRSGRNISVSDKARADFNISRSLPSIDQLYYLIVIDVRQEQRSRGSQTCAVNGVQVSRVCNTFEQWVRVTPGTVSHLINPFVHFGNLIAYAIRGYHEIYIQAFEFMVIMIYIQAELVEKRLKYLFVRKVPSVFEAYCLEIHHFTQNQCAVPYSG